MRGIDPAEDACLFLGSIMDKINLPGANGSGLHE